MSTKSYLYLAKQKVLIKNGEKTNYPTVKTYFVVNIITFIKK